MRQAIMVRPGAIEFRDVPPPVLKSGDVLLRIRCIGICGSDIHVWHGKHPFTSYPVIQGHEYSGTIEAVAPGVDGLRSGMKATARPQLVCGECDPCLRGDYNICNHLKVQGFQAPGCAQDVFPVSADQVVPLPDHVSYELGALVEPTAVAAHATARAGDLRDRDVAVFGAGPIGNLLAQAARCRGARKVLIADRSSFRLAKAADCGVDATCNTGEDSLRAASKKLFGNNGFDVAFEAAGSESALDDAVQNIRKGGTIVAVGVFGERPRVDLSILGDRELNLIGSLMYKREDYDQAVQWIASGAVRAEPLITSHFTFERFSDAYRFIDEQADRELRVMIDVG